jgi:hypothetical protein
MLCNLLLCSQSIDLPFVARGLCEGYFLFHDQNCAWKIIGEPQVPGYLKMFNVDEQVQYLPKYDRKALFFYLCFFFQSFPSHIIVLDWWEARRQNLPLFQKITWSYEDYTVSSNTNNITYMIKRKNNGKRRILWPKMAVVVWVIAPSLPPPGFASGFLPDMWKWNPVFLFAYRFVFCLPVFLPAGYWLGSMEWAREIPVTYWVCSSHVIKIPGIYLIFGYPTQKVSGWNLALKGPN